MVPVLARLDGSGRVGIMRRAGAAFGAVVPAAPTIFARGLRRAEVLGRILTIEHKESGTGVPGDTP
jgi:hypothetical protein